MSDISLPARVGRRTAMGSSRQQASSVPNCDCGGSPFSSIWKFEQTFWIPASAHNMAEWHSRDRITDVASPAHYPAASAVGVIHLVALFNSGLVPHKQLACRRSLLCFSSELQTLRNPLATDFLASYMDRQARPTNDTPLDIIPAYLHIL